MEFPFATRVLSEIIDLFSRLLLFLVELASKPFLYMAYPFARLVEYLESFWTWQLTVEIAASLWTLQLVFACAEYAWTTHVARSAKAKTPPHIPSIRLPKRALRPALQSMQPNQDQGLAQRQGAGMNTGPCDCTPLTNQGIATWSAEHPATLVNLTPVGPAAATDRLPSTPKCVPGCANGWRAPAPISSSSDAAVARLNAKAAAKRQGAPNGCSTASPGPGTAHMSRQTPLPGQRLDRDEPQMASSVSLPNSSPSLAASQIGLAPSSSVPLAPLQDEIRSHEAVTWPVVEACTSQHEGNGVGFASPSVARASVAPARPDAAEARDCRSRTERATTSVSSMFMSAFEPSPSDDVVNEAGTNGSDEVTAEEQYRYVSPAEARALRSARSLAHGPTTRATRMRATGVKLSVYLNTEVNSGYATVITLPERCISLVDVIAKIQQSMQLDKRMLYASELFLPDGRRIDSFQKLIDHAALDTAIIVGCGEPFDSSSIPFDLLQFHLYGGGREAARKVKQQLEEQRKEECLEKADHVRASGHGLDSRAAVSSKQHAQHENRKQAVEQRWNYNEQLMTRAAQQHQLMSSVKQNNLIRKLEEEERRAKREEFDAVRREALAEERKLDKQLSSLKKETERNRIKRMHDKVKSDFETSSCHSRAQRMANIAQRGSINGAYMC